jgi:hypothetical protein
MVSVVEPVTKEPPVEPGAKVPEARMNLSDKLGVPLEPLHNAQPGGIVAIEPDHIMMPPTGNGSRTTYGNAAYL